MTKPATTTNLPNSDIKPYAERICRLEDEKDGIADDIKAIMVEAKENGVDTKALRIAIRAKRRDIDTGLKTKVNEYLDALNELPLFALAR